MAGDRLEMLLAQSAVTGVDFVYVHPSQTTLDVYFHVAPDALVPAWTAPVDEDGVRIESVSERASVSRVPVVTTAWVDLAGRRVLRLETAAPGDFSRYTLELDSPRVDRRYNRLPFSFKANCPSDLDCELPPHACPPEAGSDYAVDYLARDFWSYRRALLDFASQRYPAWKDRLEADVGVMLVEVMAQVGDEMAYYQDRSARQAFLATATERRSLRRHARLVDYELHDGSAAASWLDFSVADGSVVEIPAGADVWAESGSGERVLFEVGRGLDDALAVPVRTFQVQGAWTQLLPHLWDEDESCLPFGARELWVKGHHRVSLFPVGGPSERPLMLRTFPVDPARPMRTHLVYVRAEDVHEDRDFVFGEDITRLAWDAAYATPFEIDLEVLVVRANLVPARAGQSRVARFAIGDGVSSAELPPAVERTGPGGVTLYRHSLADSDAIGLCRVRSESGSLIPEVKLFELTDAGGGVLTRGSAWEWRRSLLGVASSDPDDRHFTLEDGTYRVLLHWDRATTTLAHTDYHSGAGVSLRFGDGEFGRVPARDTRFELIYRLGNGARGNLAADTLNQSELLDPTSPLFSSDLLAVTNPLPASGGSDPESHEDVRRLAPDAFRALTYRAVRPEDYAEAVERLPAVQRAGAQLRWTGSWLSVFATPDPVGASSLSAALENDVQDQLDRFRQAGREAYVLSPTYAFLDLEIVLCLEVWAYAGQVKEQVHTALFGAGYAWSEPGFFHPDHFTFGTRLERSQLEARVQGVPGVRAVKSLRIRRRGHFALRDFSEPYYAPAANEVLGLANDPRYPERGSLRLVTEGGA